MPDTTVETTTKVETVLSQFFIVTFSIEEKYVLVDIGESQPYTKVLYSSCFKHSNVCFFLLNVCQSEASGKTHHDIVPCLLQA